MADKPIKQREHYRVPFESPVVLDQDTGDTVQGICVNISMGGICVSLDEEVKIHSSGSVRIVCKTGEDTVEFKTPYVVVWTGVQRPDVPLKHAGISFTSLDDQGRKNLTRIIVNRLMEIELEKKQGV